MAGCDTLPRVFLRKDVILRELDCEDAQGFDSRGFMDIEVGAAVEGEDSGGLVKAITTHDTAYYPLCQWGFIEWYCSNRLLSCRNEEEFATEIAEVVDLDPAAPRVTSLRSPWRHGGCEARLLCVFVYRIRRRFCR